MTDSKELQTAGRRRPPAAGKGRTLGTPNKTTAVLKEAILIAAELTGRDEEGKDGLIGYLQKVADEDVKAFCGLLGKSAASPDIRRRRHYDRSGSPRPEGLAQRLRMYSRW